MRFADILQSKGYATGQQVGEGTYSKVRTAERLDDGMTCAVKVIDKNKARTDYLRKFMPRELEIIMKLKHENVICTFEVIQTRDFVFQVMEYAEQGDVLHLIHRRGPFPEGMAKNIFRDMSNGLKYMHDMHVTHRDLKCENILIRKDNSAVICDFGFAYEFARDTTNVKCRTFCGSTAYASPELVRGIPYDPRQNDVWSSGCILFTMLCGTMPFDDSNLTKMVQKQLSKDFRYPFKVSGLISDQCKTFIKHVLEPDTNKRFAIEDVLESSWLKR